VQPTFERLTYRRGEIASAKFSPDGQTVVFSAQWANEPANIFRCARAAASTAAGFAGRPHSGHQLDRRNGDFAGARDERNRGNAGARAAVGRSAARDSRKRQRRRLVARRRESGRFAHRPRARTGSSIRSEPCATKAAASRRNRCAFRPRAIASRSSSRQRRRRLYRDSPGHERQETGFVARLAGCSGWHGRQGRRDLVRRGEGGRGTGVARRYAGGKERLVVETPVHAGRRYHARSEGAATVVDSRLGISGLAPGAKQERDLSWFDASRVFDISADGRSSCSWNCRMGRRAIPRFISARPTALQAVRLGDGNRPALSPDGKWWRAF
jgi:hypothetical protein